MKVFTSSDLVKALSCQSSSEIALGWLDPPDRRGWVSQGMWSARCEEQPPGPRIHMPQAAWDGLFDRVHKATRAPMEFVDFYPPAPEEGRSRSLLLYQGRDGSPSWIDGWFRPLLDGMRVVRLLDPRLTEPGAPAEVLPLAGLDGEEIVSVVMPIGPRQGGGGGGPRKRRETRAAAASGGVS